jgi:hypothetical protein
MQTSVNSLLSRYTFIPMGDHCLSAMLLDELGLRQEAFPFDWIVHVDEFNGSSVPVILSLVEHLLMTGGIDYLLDNFLPRRGESLLDKKDFGAVRNWIRFPHDKFLTSEENYFQDFQKYRRRTIRLYKKLIMLCPKIFLCISRSYLLSPRDIHIINEYLLSTNIFSRFIFISGNISSVIDKNSTRIIHSSRLYRLGAPPFIEYSDNLYCVHDLGYWRKDVKEQLIFILSKLCASEYSAG